MRKEDFDKIKVKIANTRGVNYFRWGYDKPCPVPNFDLPDFYPIAGLNYNPVEIALLEWQDIEVKEADFKDYHNREVIDLIERAWSADWRSWDLRDFVKAYPVTRKDIEELANCNTLILETPNLFAAGSMFPGYKGVRISINPNMGDRPRIVAHEIVHAVYRAGNENVLNNLEIEALVREEADRIIREDPELVRMAEDTFRKLKEK